MKDPRSKSFIIFDLDGTLVDSAKDIMIANNKTLEKFGYKPISFKNVKHIIGQGIRVNIIRSLKMQNVKISLFFPIKWFDLPVMSRRRHHA